MNGSGCLYWWVVGAVALRLVPRINMESPSVRLSPTTSRAMTRSLIQPVTMSFEILETAIARQISCGVWLRLPHVNSGTE